ncbi:MAG: Sip1-related alpha-galactosidase [bacterium]
MKQFIILIILTGIFSCNSEREVIKIQNDKILISERGINIENIAPYINNQRLKFETSENGTEETRVQYSDENNGRYELIFRPVISDSVSFFSISFKLMNQGDWSETDTLKVLIENTSPIVNGIYSQLYGPVYAWCKPVNFENINEIDSTGGIQFAYCQFNNNVYSSFMPMAGEGFVFSLNNDENGFGSIGVTQYPVEVKAEIPVLTLGFSNDFYQLISGTIAHSFSEMDISDNMRIKKTKPDMYNYLGWASWNVYMADINEEKLINAAKSLSEANIPVKWFLIDDGWLDITNDKLNSFRPDSLRFPNGFKSLTARLRNDFNINEIGVWHTLNGYWNGLNENGELTRQYKDLISYYDQIVWINESPTKMIFVDPRSSDSYQFYEDWYSYLGGEGINFVKVDNQLVVHELSKGNYPLWSTGERYINNFHKAAQQVFNGPVIDCMSMTNANYLHYGKSTVARTSEDYNPRNNKDLFKFTFNGNDAAHVLASIHNSVWLSQIVWPDYDMFQTNDENGWFYAVAKVLSSGPVYISDELGQHNIDIIESITFKNGKVITANEPALPTEDCLFQLFQIDKPFKVFSKYNDSGLIGAWNVSDNDHVEGSFTVADVRSLPASKYVIYDYFNKTVTEADANTEIPVELERMGCNIYSIIPIQHNVAIIGNVSKMIPQAAVYEKMISDSKAEFNMIDSGNIWVYSERKPEKIFINSVALDNYTYDEKIISLLTEEENAKVTIHFN